MIELSYSNIRPHKSRGTHLIRERRGGQSRPRIFRVDYLLIQLVINSRWRRKREALISSFTSTFSCSCSVCASATLFYFNPDCSPPPAIPPLPTYPSSVSTKTHTHTQIPSSSFLLILFLFLYFHLVSFAPNHFLSLFSLAASSSLRSLDQCKHGEIQTV